MGGDVDSDLEGQYPVVVRCDGSLFLSSLLIAGPNDQPFRYPFTKPTIEEVCHLALIQVRLLH